MRNAETVLGIIQERGQKGLPLEDIYRQLYNPNLYLLAYGRIYRNKGALTPGATGETVDGMSLAKIEAIIADLRQERYRWKPARRIYIEKKHSTKLRPLGLPGWSDKLLQEVMRLILEAYYEPQFSPTSHGFRPNRGCHTALSEIRHAWVGTKWFVEGDVVACFDSLDHTVLLSILGQKIHDHRFLRLIDSLLRTGYLEDWRYHATLSGSPQGAVLSPVLANIYLNELDQFVEQVLLPKYTRGDLRRPNPVWWKRQQAARRLRKMGRRKEALKMRRLMQQVPSHDPSDPDYRRLRYIRYADDVLLGFSGPRQEAEEIKRQIGEFLASKLKLELSERKTLITHARTQAARFLGYEIVAHHNNRKLDRRGQRCINGGIGLKVPADVVKAKCAPYMEHGKPKARPELAHDTVFTIVAQYQQVYRGLVEYYQMAFNLHELNKLKWVMEQSLTHTLAEKLKISVRSVYRRYRAELTTEQGKYVVLQVTVERGEGKKPLVARWGGISLKHKDKAILNDAPFQVIVPRAELVQRLLAETCELCGSHVNVEVHHVRALKDLNPKGRAERPLWVQVMAARQRKTLVVCRACHDRIHKGQAIQSDTAERTMTLESQVL